MSATIKFKALIPREFRIEDLAGPMGKELNAVGDVLRKDFEKTVATWSNRSKPTFKKVVTQTAAAMSVEVSTDSDIYRYVSKGTKKHVIKSKKAKSLRFRTGYSPKTRVGSLTSGGGGASGEFVSAKKVQHPGTKARKFPELIVKVRKDDVRKRLQAAINQALKQG